MTEGEARRHPKRIQRQRTKGWRMPAGAMYVGRPSQWGNPYGWQTGPIPLDPRTLNGAVDDFRTYARLRWPGDAEWLAPLRGHDLACWCPLDQPCHADALLELANR